jgi:hypothetical protein
MNKNSESPSSSHGKEQEHEHIEVIRRTETEIPFSKFISSGKYQYYIWEELANGKSDIYIAKGEKDQQGQEIFRESVKKVLSFPVKAEHLDAIASTDDIFIVHSEYDGEKSRLVFSESNDAGGSFKPCDIQPVPLPGKIIKLTIDLYENEPAVFSIIKNETDPKNAYQIARRRWKRH